MRQPDRNFTGTCGEVEATRGLPSGWVRLLISVSRTRMNFSASLCVTLIHDPLDSVSTAAALGTASEAGIDLAHAGPSRLFCDH